MTEHVLYVCPGTAPNCPGAEDVPRTCVFCDGALGLCTVCGGAEGAMPTDCPGRMISERESDLVMGGITDYIDGKWQPPITGRSDNAPRVQRVSP